MNPNRSLLVMLLGTNRLKLGAEVSAAGKSLGEIRIQFGKLPAAAPIFWWCASDLIDMRPPLTVPPPEIVGTLQSFAHDQGLSLRNCDS